MSGKEEYVEDFKQFNNADTAHKEKYNAKAAPHQPILLLALIKLYKEDKIDLKNIDPRSEDLLSTAEEIWENWLGYNREFNINQPLLCLGNIKDFWKYKLKDGFDDLRKAHNVPTNVEVFYIDDDELIKLLNYKESRNKLVEALVESGRILSDRTKLPCFKYREKIKEKMGLEISNR